MIRRPPARAGLLILVGLLASAGAAVAQVNIHPGGGIVYVSSDSKANTADDPETQEGPDYGVWGLTLLSQAHDNLTGADAGAYLTITSSFDPTGFGVTRPISTPPRSVRARSLRSSRVFPSRTSR